MLNCYNKLLHTANLAVLQCLWHKDKDFNQTCSHTTKIAEHFTPHAWFHSKWSNSLEFNASHNLNVNDKKLTLTGYHNITIASSKPIITVL